MNAHTAPTSTEIMDTVAQWLLPHAAAYCKGDVQLAIVGSFLGATTSSQAQAACFLPRIEYALTYDVECRGCKEGQGNQCCHTGDGGCLSGEPISIDPDVNAVVCLDGAVSKDVAERMHAAVYHHMVRCPKHVCVLMSWWTPDIMPLNAYFNDKYYVCGTVVAYYSPIDAGNPTMECLRAARFGFAIGRMQAERSELKQLTDKILDLEATKIQDQCVVIDNPTQNDFVARECFRAVLATLLEDKACEFILAVLETKQYFSGFSAIEADAIEEVEQRGLELPRAECPKCQEGQHEAQCDMC